MPKRSQTLRRIQLDGGVSSASNDLLVGPTQLAQADNIELIDTPIIKKREGIDKSYSDIGYHLTEINCVADVSNSLNGKGFTLRDSGGTVFFWIDVNNGGTAKPGSGSETRAVEITTINTNDSAPVVASKIRNAIAADSAFWELPTEDTIVRVMCSTKGTLADSADGHQTTGGLTTGFSISNPQPSIIALHDFWYQKDKVKSQIQLAFDDYGCTYTCNQGTLTNISFNKGSETILIPPSTRSYLTWFVFYSALDEQKFLVRFNDPSTPATLVPTAPTEGAIIIHITTGVGLPGSGYDMASTVKTALEANSTFATYFTATLASNSNELVLTQKLNGPFSPSRFITDTTAAGGESVHLLTRTPGASAWYPSPQITTTSLGNYLYAASGDRRNSLKYWNPSTSYILEVTQNTSYDRINDPDPPKGGIVQQFQGRLLLTDPDDFDLLHYSETFNPLKWQGAGDSGARHINKGDGDQSGIRAIFPQFKGELFLGKAHSLYRISGPSVEQWQLTQISKGIGVAGPHAFTMIDQDDILFVSSRGVHSLSATNAFGDFSSKFISKNIQEAFNRYFDKTQLTYTWAAYLPNINSVAFSIADTTLSAITDASSTARSNCLWLYNLEKQAWYRWSNISTRCVITANDLDRDRFYLGTTTGRIYQTQTGRIDDVSEAGSDTAISMTLKTGRIIPNEAVETEYLFKNFGLIYRPNGTQSVSASVQFDMDTAQTATFADAAGTNGFILGTTNLGTSYNTLGPNTITASFGRAVEGIARSFVVSLSDSTSKSTVELLGYEIMLDVAGDAQEVIQ